MSAQSDEQRPKGPRLGGLGQRVEMEPRRCFKCGSRGPLNADSLCITCGEPDDAVREDDLPFNWTCPRCGSQHPSTVERCPCVYEDSF